jgi:hypothetical protein
MNQFGEVARTRRASMNVATGSGKLAEKRFNATNWILFATYHEAGTVSSSIDTATSPQVDKVDALFKQPLMTPY